MTTEKVEVTAGELAQLKEKAVEVGTLRDKLNETVRESITRKEKIRDLEAKLDEIQGQLAERSGDLTKVVENLNAKIANLTSELESAKDALEKATAETTSYKQKVEAIEAEQKREFDKLLERIPEEQRQIYSDLNPAKGVQVLKAFIDTKKAPPVPGSVYGGRAESEITKADVLNNGKLYKEMKTRNPELLKKLIRG